MKRGILTYLVLALGGISTAKADQEPLGIVSQANNLFSSQFYNAVNKSSNGNLIVSPISVSTVLAMLQAGARGDTKQAIRSTLHFPEDEQLNSGYHSLIQNLKSDDNVTIELVNRIYPAEDLELNPDFTHTLKTYYAAEPQQLNYTANEEAARIINTFVSNSTRGKICNLVKPDDLDSSTRLTLINAVYFKGIWETSFLKDATHKSTFHVSENDEPVEVNMMFMTSYLLYGYIPELDAHAVSLPYKGNRFSLIILLPFKLYDLDRMEDKLKNLPLKNIADKLHQERIDLFLPKFKLESTIDLEQSLTQLGLGDIFSKENADLTGISGKHLVVGKAVQKASIEVNEAGSEASAATAVIPVANSPLVQPTTFRADHPFLFILANQLRNGDKQILFVGRVANPTAF